METREDQMLRAVCQFLAGTDEQKLSYLPVADPSTSYVYNECGDRTGNPLVFYCHAAHELLARQVGQHQGQLSEILMEIGSILAVLIEVGRRNPYVWHLDKETYPISGECDGLWSVLRRLASSVLEARGWPRTSPDVPFREVGWSGVRLSGFEGLGEAGPGEGRPESERAELNWQISTDPRPMLGLLREAASERKLRLFASACWRRVAHALDEDSMREGAAILERSADGADPGRLLADAHASADPKTRVLANSPHPASYAAANVLFMRRVRTFAPR